ncbi:hypothetical protein GUA87_06655 [Sneathiella sp. P13V-1]|uniref:COG4648 family protein n=1 Tax=Sneathiella sp. P13V-1 TaxID=2697366 RepID=UPI00187B53DC|nr:hypothetical protein [Sneathiella sp. P13V-1]MBE7636520.1 hypothetical protein [Sneathiella sp. P13V-1]
MGLSYPFLVYFGLTSLPPGIFIIGILVVLALRLVFMKSAMRSDNRLFWPFVIAFLLLLGGVLFKGAVSFKFYPVAISCLLALAFFWSILNPPTIIEMIARLKEPDLAPSGVQYTRKVTIVWILFFAINASIALWTATYGTLEQWTVYNGFISYCLTGLLFAGEYAFRLRIRRNESGAE